jgi:hypothetical protein
MFNHFENHVDVRLSETHRDPFIFNTPLTIGMKFAPNQWFSNMQVLKLKEFRERHYDASMLEHSVMTIFTGDKLNLFKQRNHDVLVGAYWNDKIQYK